VPHPLAKNLIAENSSRCVEQRPECVKLIGLIASEWSNIETTVAYYFAFFIFGFRDEDTQKLHGGELIAIDVMENTPSFQSKIALLLNAAHARFGDDDAGCKKLEDELGRVRKRLIRRNEVVHGRWAICETEPSSLIWRGRVSHADYWIYDVTDFEEILQHIIDAHRSLNAHLAAEFDARLQVLPIPKSWHVIVKQ
jgi:hypothetical protein